MSGRPILLDLFCGPGGGAVGYSRAGFDVVGVDIEPQPNYPFEFQQLDAIEVLGWIVDPAHAVGGYFAGDFDVIHASTPCQDHIRGGLQRDHGTGWMLAASRKLLEQSGVPWVIENVPGAPMRPDYMLCGSNFGLTVRRHRWFETSWHGFSLMPACDHSGPVVGVYGHPHGQRGAWPGMLPGTIGNWQAGLGIDWTADPEELKLAIPPAYTEYIGAELLAHMRERSAA